MKTNRFWHGTRMRTVSAAAEADLRPREVTLPAAWDDEAAAGLAAIAPGNGAVDLARAVDGWIGRLAPAGKDDALRLLLLQRRCCPTASLWRGETGEPTMLLNVAAFHDVALGFEVDAFAEAATLTAEALRRVAPDASRAVALTGLDLLLATLGLDYGGIPARNVAACLAGLVRGRIAQVSDGQHDLLAVLSGWPAAPRCQVPGLSEAANLALAHAARMPGQAARLTILPAGPEDAVLGVETAGIAPGFSPVHPDGRLTRSAQARLVALGLSAEAALALTLLGETPLAPAEAAAYDAMRQAVAPWAELPAITSGETAVPLSHRENLPERHGGLTRRVTVGGHRLHLRTAEYADGRLGEITVTLPRDGATLRGLMDSFSSAASLALQHGVPLNDLVEAFAGTRFGPGGAVEGDPVVTAATSLIDYVFRALAAAYLGRTLEPAEIAAPPMSVVNRTPLLPLDWPEGIAASGPAARRRAFRLVG